MTIAFQNLLKFQLLRDMPQAELLRLSTHAELVQVSKREVLFAGKERSFPLGFLLEGRLQGVDLTDGGLGSTTLSAVTFLESKPLWTASPSMSTL